MTDSTRNPMRVLFPYVGGKKRLMSKWTLLFPPHGTYVRVFGGSGADILFKPPSTIEVFNDLDSGINNLFRVLRKQEAELVRLVQRTPARSRETYCEALHTLNASDATDLDRAWAFLVVAHQGFRMAHPRLQSQSQYAGLRTNTRCMTEWLKLPETIPLVCDRLHRVQLERLDFRDVILKFDSTDTFFFVDPPYHPATRRENLYAHEMSEQDHAELLALLNQVKAKVFLCGYARPVSQCAASLAAQGIQDQKV